jgi:hypothetical protein
MALVNNPPLKEICNKKFDNILPIKVELLAMDPHL